MKTLRNSILCLGVVFLASPHYQREKTAAAGPGYGGGMGGSY